MNTDKNWEDKWDNGDDEDEFLTALVEKKKIKDREVEEIIPRVDLTEDTALYERALEAILFACREPMPLSALKERVPDSVNIHQHLVHLQQLYQGRGIELREINGHWAFRTASDLSFLLQREVAEVRRLNKST
jgi:segregation and condensation protein B